MAAPSSTVNFATKMIADIRSDMNAQALANNLPVPTDAQVESEVDKAFDKIKNKPYGDFVLREFKDWWLVDGPVFSAPPKPPPVIPPISLITRPSNLMLSSTAPSVVGGIFFQPHSITTLQGNLALSSVAPIFNPLPGQPGNSVGFAAAPGYPGSLTAASGPLTSGSSGNPTVYSFKDFTGLSIDANWVTFIGCRFKSNVVADNNVSTGGTGAQNIVFSYCSFTPLNSLYGSPPGAAWPSAGAGLQTTTFVTDVNCIDGNSGYQFGLTVRNATDGPITFDHCDIWGFGNALNFPAPTTAQITVQDCWIHDAANASPQSYHTDGPGYTTLQVLLVSYLVIILLVLTCHGSMDRFLVLPCSSATVVQRMSGVVISLRFFRGLLRLLGSNFLGCLEMTASICCRMAH